MIQNRELIRQNIINNRKNIRNKNEIDKQILDKLFSLDCISNSKMIFCYVSTKFEIDTFDIIKKLLLNKNICIPKVKRNSNYMDAVRLSSLNSLKTGEYGILESVEKEIVEKSYIDIVIVPALCFDLSGYRLGYGKGFYDRYLSDFKGKKIGLCPDEFILNSVFAQPHDIPVDIIVTEKRIIYCDKF